ncbi:MAG: WcaI family glycosyltransferase [Candidatus Methylacidiphilales bacterium]
MILDRNKKELIVYGINFAPELTGIGKYTSDMVDWLVENNIKCTVVTSFPYYPYWQIQKPYKGLFYKKEVSNNGLLTIYRCPMYVPKKVSGFKRILHEASFLISSFFIFFYLLFKPKISNVFCVAPPFHLGLVAIFYKFFKGATITYHVQDLQIEAAKNLRMIKGKVLLAIFSKIELYIFKNVDEISSISKNMISKLVTQSNKEVIFFPNWVDNKAFYPLRNPKLNRKKWGFSENDKIVLYSGSIGEKQGLNQLVELAQFYQSNKKLKFIVASSGSYSIKLQNEVNELKIKNIYFLPLQSKEVYNEFLNIADVHLILQKKNAADLVMPSKLTTLMAIGGLTIIGSEKGTELYELIKTNNLGLLVDPENINDLKNAIEKSLSNNYDEIRLNARNFALYALDKEMIINKFMNNS